MADATAVALTKSSATSTATNDASTTAVPPVPHPAAPAASAGAPAPNLAISEDDQLLWQKVLQTFRDKSRMSTVACLQQAAFAGFANGRCYLTFPTDMLAQLTMRIYRTQVEQVLATLFGHDMQLVCTANAAPPPPPPAPPKPAKPAPPPMPYEEKPATVDMNALPPEQQKNLQHAVDILGDNFIEPPPPISDADAPPPPEEE